jgi:nucleotide-binding universal stress UspA family protein
VTSLLQERITFQMLAEKAEREGADMIVIGTRGLDRPKRLMLGSVSSGVVASSEIQVLVVRWVAAGPRAK